MKKILSYLLVLTIMLTLMPGSTGVCAVQAPVYAELAPEAYYEAVCNIETADTDKSGWKLRIWLSRNINGALFSDAIKTGEWIYLNYEILTDDSEAEDPSDYGINYTVTPYIFKPDGSISNFQEYENERYGWLGINHGEDSVGGIQTGRVVVEGDISYVAEVSWILYDTEPSITVHPQSMYVNEGDSAEFEVKATGSNLKYQWYASEDATSEGSAIKNAVSSKYVISSVAAEDAGKYYYCKISNYGNADVCSDYAYLSCNASYYTITYHANGGINAPDVQTKKSGEYISISRKIPERFPYTFMGWSTSPSSAEVEYKPKDEYSDDKNLNLYAVWGNPVTLAAPPCEASAEITAGGTCRFFEFVPEISGMYVFETTLADQSSEGYLYDSYGNELAYCDEYDEITGLVKVKITYNLVAGNTYYYAAKFYANSRTGNISVKLYEKPAVCTVTYNYSQNGGTSSTHTSATVFSGSSANLNATASKPGWVFAGWNTYPSAKEALTSYIVNDDVTLYAIFEKVISVKFYSKNNSLQFVGAYSLFNKEKKTEITLPAPASYENYTINGWRTDKSAAEAVYNSGETFYLSEDTEFFAVYTGTVTLSYNSNGGKTTPDSRSAGRYINSGGNMQYVKFTLAPEILRSGYTFKKWAEGSEYGTAYAPGAEISINTDTEMYAVWTDYEDVDGVDIYIDSCMGGKILTLETDTAGASIYYTTDGTMPDKWSEKYEEPVSFNEKGAFYIRAIAIKNGYSSDSVASATVRVSEAKMPEISSSGTTVTITCETPDPEIYYTTNGTTPTVDSKKYNGSFNLYKTATIKAISIANGYAVSDVETYYYSYNVNPDKFTMLEDNYRFVNTSSSFGYSSSYKIPLERYISVFGTTNGRAKYNNSGNWGGSCFGFSATTGMFLMDYIDYNEFDSSADCLYDIRAPKSPSAELTKFMERYQICQTYGDIGYERNINKTTHSANDVAEKTQEIIDAVKNFEKTGRNPIILCVRRTNGGHAVFPYKVRENSDGTVDIYVYDNNSPDDKNLCVEISKNRKSFYYSCGNTYTLNMSYVYIDTVYREMMGVSLMDSAEEKNGRFTVYINTRNAVITTKDGTDVANIEGAYLVELDDTTGHDNLCYELPAGEYKAVLKDASTKSFKVDVANDYDYKSIETDDAGAVILFGTCENPDQLYAIVNAGLDSSNTLKMLDENGIYNVFESSGTTLGVTPLDFDTVNLTADSKVMFNGDIVDTDLFSEIPVKLPAPDGASDKSYEAEIKNNTLRKTNSGIYGNFSVNIYNRTDEFKEVKLILALYNKEGKLLGISSRDEVLSLDKTYVNLGDIEFENASNENCILKFMVWDCVNGLEPVTEALMVNIS